MAQGEHTVHVTTPTVLIILCQECFTRQIVPSTTTEYHIIYGIIGVSLFLFCMSKRSRTECPSHDKHDRNSKYCIQNAPDIPLSDKIHKDKS